MPKFGYKFLSYFGKWIGCVIIFSISGPSDKLIAKRPMGSLVAMKNIIPLLLQVATFAFIQMAALYYLYRQHWFKSILYQGNEPVIVGWENTVLFTISSYQYVILATVYSKGKPYRQRLITNFWFLVSAVLLTVFTTWIMVYPCREMAKIMDLVIVSGEEHEQIHFRFTLTAFPILHFILALLIEVSKLISACKSK